MMLLLLFLVGMADVPLLLGWWSATLCSAQCSQAQACGRSSTIRVDVRITANMSMYRLAPSLHCLGC